MARETNETNETNRGGLLTTGEVATLLAVHPKTVRALANRGALPAVRLTHTSPRRFHHADVYRLVEQGVTR